MDTTPTPTATPLASGLLADPWVEWVAHNALRGLPEAELVAAVVAAGADPESARIGVSEVLCSPILAGARAAGARGAAMERAARLHRAVDPEPLLVRETLDEETLYQQHWLAHRPLVLRGAAASWPAARWTFADLRRRYPWAPLDVLVRRPGWWLEARVIRRMSFGELVDVALGPPSDALYADGRTNVLDQAGLAPLRAELGLLPGLVGDGHPRLWVGPAGTVTPTHHDQSTAWQVLLVGRKRLHLASPLEVGLARTAFGLYNTVDPREPPDPAEDEVRWHQVDLAPGDAALVPVGWWHQVEALEPSISVSMSGFRWPNAHPWYCAGPG